MTLLVLVVKVGPAKMVDLVRTLWQEEKRKVEERWVIRIENVFCNINKQSNYQAQQFQGSRYFTAGTPMRRHDEYTNQCLLLYLYIDTFIY